MRFVFVLLTLQTILCEKQWSEVIEAQLRELDTRQFEIREKDTPLDAILEEPISRRDEQHRGDGQYARKLKSTIPTDARDAVECTSSGSNLSCESPSTRLAVVIPVEPSTYDLVTSNLISWTSSEYYPCHEGAPFRTDLVFLVNRESLMSSVRHHFLPLLSGPLKTMRTECFGRVHFFSIGLRDQDDVVEVPESEIRFIPNREVHTFVQMFDLFGTKYTHIFWMAPETRPVRREWLHRLWEEAAFAGDVWMSGPHGKPRPKENVCGGESKRVDVERIATPALLRISSKRFRDFMRKAQWQRPDSIEAAIFDYLYRCDLFSQSQQLLPFFRVSGLVIVSPPWPVLKLSQFLHQFPDAHFLSGFESVAVLTGVYPCGSRDNNYFPAAAVFPPICKKWSSTAVPTIAEIDANIAKFQGLPSSPWGVDLSVSAAKVWTAQLPHDEQTAGYRRDGQLHLLRMRVREYRLEWCREMVNAKCASASNETMCWQRCFDIGSIEP